MLCIGISNHDHQLHMRMRDDDGDVVEWPLLEHLRLGTDGARECIGTQPPGAPELLPCTTSATGVSGTQCDECFAQSLILPCLRCNGERCANPARRTQCVQPDNHALYLASFADGLVKVGVARWERRHERVREQGARLAWFVARDDGQQIRRLESQIKRLGLPDRLSTSERLHALGQPAGEDVMRGDLERATRELRLRLRGRWLDDAEELLLPGPPPTPYVPRLRRPEPGTRVQGRLVGFSGQIMLVESVGGEWQAWDAHSLVGFRWRRVGQDDLAPEQLLLV